MMLTENPAITDTTKTDISPDELLAGAGLTFRIVVPSQVLRPQLASQPADQIGDKTNTTDETESALIIQLKPLTVGTFQLIMKAARQDAGLIPLLMIKESLVQPALSLDQVRGMHMGLVNFLIAQIRQISGLDGKKTSAS
ncbi:MAG: hypothetical protein AAFP03_08995 [Cyanobacteria bacterium J06598_3]